ncbi:unnamed protein product [Oreochromis niloticus]|nr:unnamed protein product [Mustela putorius furo]
MLSQVVPVPGVGQVGQGLENSWGLEDDDEDDYEEEKNDNSGDEQVEEVTKMDVGEGDVVEISDIEEEEVVILNPEVPEKPKNTGSKSHQKGAAASKKRQKK